MIASSAAGYPVFGAFVAAMVVLAVLVIRFANRVGKRRR